MNNSQILNEIHDSIEGADLARLRQILTERPELLGVSGVFGTWLHVAADAGHLPVVQWLIEAGIDVNKRAGIAGGNALNEAAMESREDVVRYLLSVGAEMDVSEPERNPLFSAIQDGNSKIVRLLLERGIDASVRYSGKNMNNMGAYEFALEQGQREIATIIEDWLAKRHH